jgi:hypothetical protein
VLGKDVAGDSFTGTEDITDSFLTEKIARVREVSINMIAAIVVTLLSTVAAPLLPKRVWLDPPKAAPISAPLLLWIRIIKIRKRHTII